MTAPREVLPGRTYLITRRCTQRQFLLRPSKLTNQIVQYCLAYAAEQTGVLLHAVCFMSNHWHGVVSDPFARLPEFLEHFHRLVAKAMNASLGRWENFWSSDKTSVVLLVSDSDVLDKMAYALTNPVTAGLVKAPDEWPGILASWSTSRLGRGHRELEMPDVFFDDSGALPEQVTLELVRPPIFPELDDAALARRLADSVADLVRKARETMRETGKEFLGARAVLRQAFSAVPKTPAPRRGLSPRIAARDTKARIAAIQKLVAFLREYRAAWLAWRNGQRDVLFPVGTYALRIYARVACAPAVPA